MAVLVTCKSDDDYIKNEIAIVLVCEALKGELFPRQKSNLD